MLFRSKKQLELENTIEQRTEKEIKQLKADKEQYVLTKDHNIHILHISDLHLKNRSQANVYRTQLEIDLTQELKVNRLDYLIISGDIVNHATEDEYRIAFKMLDGLVKHFGLDAGRVIIVPGNHDLNWDASEDAYKFVPKRKLPEKLPKGKYIPAGRGGKLLRDENLYQQRFANFSTQFYKQAYGGREYPVDYSEQSILFERPQDRIIFLSLNSCWQIDHYFRDRASIHMDALSHSLDQLRDGKYNSWLKIAVWHHPIAGEEMMNNEFMELLATCGFQICMHGHIHEAIDGFHKYDDIRGINIIGAGTFGAPTREQVPGIPLQYNLLTFDPIKGEMIVNTRRKEKPNGAWSADARWGNKGKDPKPYYSFLIKNYQSNR